MTVSTQVQDLSQKQVAQLVTNTVPAAVPTQPVVVLDGFQVITQKTVNWNGTVVQIAHRCNGQVKAGNKDGFGVSYCIGENQLVLIDAVSNMKVLKAQTVTTAVDAPILLDAALIPSAQKNSANVLISFSKETCTTMNNCDLGMPTNYVTFVYDLNSGLLRSITNYPQFGVPVWNPSGTKAIFVADTCGGAGCDVLPLDGYDLVSDTTKTVTTVKAASINGGGQATDESGNKLPQWGLVSWKDDINFMVTVNNGDGSQKVVTGKY